MTLLLGESLLVVKLHLIMTSFLTTPTPFASVKREIVIGKIAKPRAVPVSAGECTFATAKSNKQ